MIYCVMFSGVALSESARTLLFQAATRLIREGKDRCRVVHDDVEGFVETEGERLVFGGVSGQTFSASVMTPKGETKVVYIVRDSEITDEELDQAKWVVWSKKNKKRRKNPKPSDN